MNIEFHYYITYLIAKKAGLSVNDSLIIAYSSQYVDDNSMIFCINEDSSDFYTNYISQTMNILKPKFKLFRIYPLFHFIPGEPLSENAMRKDGKMHWLNTTPDSPNANKILDRAISTKNNYRIGVALHSFADTWAHQNFIGYYDGFNSLSGLLEKAIPDIGHADAKHNPDWAGLVWKDKRLLGERAKINNSTRFCAAAIRMLEKLYFQLNENPQKEEFIKLKNELESDIQKAILERDQNNSLSKTRIQRYLKLSQTKAYGNKLLKMYDEDEWFDEVVDQDVKGLIDKSDSLLSRWDPFTDIYTWKKGLEYKQTHWYQFQEAVKYHQNDAWEILEESTFSKLDLDINTL